MKVRAIFLPQATRSFFENSMDVTSHLGTCCQELLVSVMPSEWHNCALFADPLTGSVSLCFYSLDDNQDAYFPKILVVRKLTC